MQCFERMLFLIVNIDFFIATINNEILFDVDHPFYDDKEFIARLLTHYTEVEEYETCAYLQELIKK